MSATHPICVDAIHPDPDAAIALTEHVLGWTFDLATADGHRVARLGDRPVAGIAQGPPGLPHGAWIMYIEVADRQVTAQAVINAGGSLVLDTDRGAIFVDHDNAAFGICEAGAFEPAVRDGAPGTWAMSFLHTSDLTTAEAFYGTVFGWRLQPHPSGLTSWTTSDSDDVLAVASAIDPAQKVPPHWAFTVAVDDVDAAAARTVAAGGTVLIEPLETPGFRNVVINDAAHAVIAFSQRL